MKKRKLFLFFCCFFFLSNHSQNTSTTPVERIKNKTSILTPKFQQTRDHDNPNFQFFKIGLFCCFSAFVFFFWTTNIFISTIFPVAKINTICNPQIDELTQICKSAKNKRKIQILQTFVWCRQNLPFPFIFFFYFFLMYECKYLSLKQQRKLNAKPN